MKRSFNKTVPAKLIAAVLAVAAAFMLTSCEKLNELVGGWGDEFGNLIQELENEENGTSQPEGANGKYDFVSKDVDGRTVRLSDFKDASVVMINYWEPWCGPCLREMPDLARLYENYKDKGLVIVGVFSETGMDKEVRDIIADDGITYPVVRKQGVLKNFNGPYVPTTLFVDANGNPLSDSEVVGSKSYDEWERILKLYLE